MNGTTEAWLQHVCWSRSHYRLPPRADTQAHAIVEGALALLFPHLAHERRCEPESVLGEIHMLRGRLHAFLSDNGSSEADAERTSGEFIDLLPVVHEALILDAQATCDADPAAANADEVILAYPGLYALACQRLAHDLLHLGVTLLPRLITELAHRTTGIDIHPGARLGRSIAIDHGTGIVIGETTVIGDRVRLYQGVTLGALSVKKALASTKRHPTIEDEVVIYANATILGGDTVVGRGSVIGGNVWLTHSVPPRSIVTHTAPLELTAGPRDDHLLEYHL
jgi:serine O-acetyltransferase